MNNNEETNVDPGSQKPVCGIIMPISEIDGCSKAHWVDVRGILSEAIEFAGFDPHLVSDADDVGIIQKRIIQNLYENPIVVCDVSGKNPNVMFELGMRLAFDKPVVIIKDDKTPYSFDTGPIEHLEYPRDLRFNKIVDFKDDLAEKLLGTYQKATADKTYTPFLKHFGTFNVAQIDTREISRDQFIIEELQTLGRSITELRAELRAEPRGESSAVQSMMIDLPRQKRRQRICLHDVSDDQIKLIAKDLEPIIKNGNIFVRKMNATHFHLEINSPDPQDWEKLINKAKEQCQKARLM